MAIKSSFKQQCPSCEAMVPIRDPKLIGKKTDCPKCKYRFVVEEPAGDVEEVEEVEEAPAKKGKNGATGITNKKPVNGKAATKKSAKAEEDDEDEAKPKKKKTGKSPMLLIGGISLAVVAVIALGVGGYFLFFGDKKSGSSPSASNNPPPRQGPGGPKGGPNRGGNVPPMNNPGGGQTEGAQAKKDEASNPNDVKAKQDDITNLLPNDTQLVVNLPMERLLANPTFKKAVLMTPGSFHEDSFQRTWGMAPSEVRRVVMGLNSNKKSVFSIMRTGKPIQEAALVKGLHLKAEAPINEMRYYLVQKAMDSLSTLLLKGNASDDTTALHFVDSTTVVCADLGAMREFLQAKGQPKHLYKPPEDKAAPQPQGGTSQPPTAPGGNRSGKPQPQLSGAGGSNPPAAQRGGGPGGGKPVAGGGGLPPPMQGPTRPEGQQGGGGGNLPPPMQGPTRPGGGGPPAPNGMPPGMSLPDLAGSNPADPAPVSSSYVTIDPHLKATLDQAEKVDKKSGHTVLLSVAVSTPAFPRTIESLKKLRSLLADESRLGFFATLNLARFMDDAQTVAFAVTQLSESKITGTVAVSAKDKTVTQEWQKALDTALPLFTKMQGLDLVSKNPTPNNAGGMMGGRPGMGGGMMGGRPGMGGAPPGPPPPGGGGGFPPAMQQQPRGGGGGGGIPPPMQQQPRGGGGGGGFPPAMQQQPRGGGGGGFPPPMQQGMRGGGPMPPAGPGGMGQGGNAAPQPQGKDGDYVTWTKDDVLALSFHATLKNAQADRLSSVIDLLCVFLRGEAAMTDRAWHVHELAVALQAYLAKEGRFPRGTVARPTDTQRGLDWRPDQRLSWMATILPYLPSGAYRKVTFDTDKAWYEGNNQNLGAALIPQFLTPRTGNDSFLYYVRYPNRDVGNVFWGATHFVGVAGVGYDAADYRANDPATAKLRGIFGYDRETSKQDVKDGLDQTIALIQVPVDPKSPWIAGGGSTVRGVSEDLDCFQPFVCAEYQGKRGAFAIMGDGKVRFIPSTIDPKKFQALCTIAGGEKVGSIDSLAPEVPPPEEAKEEQVATNQPAPLVKPNAGGGWTAYTSKEGSFTVSLPPGKVVQQTQKVNLPGIELTVHIYGVEIAGGKVQYLTMSTMYPDAVDANGADKIFEVAKQGFAASIKGAKITAETKITLAGNPGREWTLEVAGEGSIKSHVFLVKNQMLQFMAGGDPGAVSPQDLQKFFDSIRLTK